MKPSTPSNEIKSLVQKYNELLIQKDSVVLYTDKLIKSINNEIKSLNNKGFFSKSFTKEFFKNKKTDCESEINLIKDVYIFRKLSWFYNEIINFNKNKEVGLKANLKLIKKVSNPLLGIFINKKRKSSVDGIYISLKNNLNDSFYSNIKSFFSYINNTDKLNKNEILNDFNSDKKKYYISISNHLNFQPENVTEFKELLNYYEDKILLIKNFLNQKKSLNEAVVRSIQVMASEELAKILKAIPVEDLSKEKLGIRIKNIKDAGYNNMYDLYMLRSYQITSIYGIGTTNAYEIEKTISKIVDESKRLIKIKLSYDNQNKTSTNIIKNVYKYLKWLESYQLIKKLNTEYKYEEKVNNLYNLNNYILWYFLSDNEKRTLIDSYSSLNQNKSSFERDLIKINLNPLNKTITSQNCWEDFRLNSIKYYNVIEEICPGVLGNDDPIYGIPKDLALEIQEECFFPDGLLCTLRKYQEWGVKYILHQRNVLLGDEMGLGKTIQAIATMVSLKNVDKTHFLVICPASVVSNWCREIVRHSKLNAIRIHGTYDIQSLNDWMKKGGVGVTTFETAKKINGLIKRNIHLLVIDEAHYIKNPNAARTEACKEICLKAERILFMTGTALENRVEEMIELVRILNPKVSSEIERFAHISSAPQFREKVAPVYYRRKREDVLSELPDLIENKEWCEMNEEEEAVYIRSLVSGNFMEVRQLSWNVSDLSFSSKFNRLKEIVEDAKDDNRKVIVFSYFLKTIDKVFHALGPEICSIPITGKVSADKRQAIIDEFDKAPAGSVLLAQIQSGGTGLNIQSASVVVICEPQFKPSIENQAISRAYRMGQARNVLVFRLLCEDSIDEKIDRLLLEKQIQFDAFADISVAAQKEKEVEIDDNSIGKMIEEEIKRISEIRGYDITEVTSAASYSEV